MEQSRDGCVWKTACVKEKNMVGEEMMLYVKNARKQRIGIHGMIWMPLVAYHASLV